VGEALNREMVLAIDQVHYPLCGMSFAHTHRLARRSKRSWENDFLTHSD